MRFTAVSPGTSDSDSSSAVCRCPGRVLSGARTVMANGALSGDVPMPRVTVTTTGSSVTLRAVIESRAGDFASEGALVESCERAVSVRPSGNAKSIAARAMNVIGLDNRRIEHAHGSSVALTRLVQS